jgi:anti-sigma factor RsiW
VEELSCQELVELVTDYFDGALPSDERARFEAHVAECPGCDRYLAQMRATITLAAESRAVEESPDVASLLAAFRDWKRAS